MFIRPYFRYHDLPSVSLVIREFLLIFMSIYVSIDVYTHTYTLTHTSPNQMSVYGWLFHIFVTVGSSLIVSVMGLIPKIYEKRLLSYIPRTSGSIKSKLYPLMTYFNLFLRLKSQLWPLKTLRFFVPSRIFLLFSQVLGNTFSRVTGFDFVDLVVFFIDTII